jgi:hypothetical protein
MPPWSRRWWMQQASRSVPACAVPDPAPVAPQWIETMARDPSTGDSGSMEPSDPSKHRDTHAHQGRTGRAAVRAARSEQARVEGHGGGLFRAPARRAGDVATRSSSPALATFKVRRKAPRPGRNPRTGEAIPIKARNVVTFHASHKLKASRARGHTRRGRLRVKSEVPLGSSLILMEKALPAIPAAKRYFTIGEVSELVRGEAVCAAVLGAGIHPAQADEAARQPPLLPAP